MIFLSVCKSVVRNDPELIIQVGFFVHVSPCILFMETDYKDVFKVPYMHRHIYIYI